MTAVALNVRPLELTHELFTALCRSNPDLRLERSPRGELIVMAPAGSNSGRRNARLNHRLLDWADRDRTGVVFDSSTGFTLPNGAIRSPDAAWIRRERWQALSLEQQEGFAPLSPDFVIELRSASDDLNTLQLKMEEYLANGVQLGWLIDPQARRVEIYRPGHPVQRLENPALLSAELLPGWQLDVQEIFDLQ
ncbi:Uma2 family endonuclease [Gloeobacter kilaueensis]|uniref:Putative restriction endonuclease domain-containing protein n=1 Tax=Gloeobacter kilaueensis (strain ATCC BAA-2537 / CCAP 1431/1 / ULC 316 / JS1) TaxID=1183438 RepID=U5QL43_GLOK1|nr:Uma2 family endonuclease [Gloeobacter kilaueensis]AGY59656.1 hypothetical protein GKIL_3410 [Gloeobacter kilaueensis JS1]